MVGPMAKNKKNSGAAVKNKAMLQEMLLKNAINMDMRKAFDKGTQQGTVQKRLPLTTSCFLCQFSAPTVSSRMKPSDGQLKRMWAIAGKAGQDENSIHIFIAFKTVAGLPFFFFCVTLNSNVLLSYPRFLLIVPNRNGGCQQTTR